MIRWKKLIKGIYLYHKQEIEEGDNDFSEQTKEHLHLIYWTKKERRNKFLNQIF